MYYITLRYKPTYFTSVGRITYIVLVQTLNHAQSITYFTYLLTYLLHTITVDVVFYAVFNTTAMYTVSPFVS